MKGHEKRECSQNQQAKESLKMDLALSSFDGTIQPFLKAFCFYSYPKTVKPKAEKKLSYFEAVNGLADLIELLPEATEIVIKKLRSDWKSVSAEDREQLEGVARKIQEVHTKRGFKQSLSLSLILLIPSIARRKNLYASLVSSLLQFSDAVVSIVRAWEEIEAELSEARTELTQSGVYDADDDLELLLRPSTESVERCEVVDWGKPRGAEVW